MSREGKNGFPLSHLKPYGEGFRREIMAELKFTRVRAHDYSVDALLLKVYAAGAERVLLRSFVLTDEQLASVRRPEEFIETCFQKLKKQIREEVEHESRTAG